MNNKNEKFSINKRLRSFVYALQGIRTLFREEHNARLHLLFALLAILLGAFLDISLSEWILICILIALVFAMEMINSAIESICDLVSPQRNTHVKKAKDLAAGAVLICALIALICGAVIFFPKIWILLKS